MQYFPVLTADEQELIFTRRVGGGQEDDEDLVVSKKDSNGKWQKPVSLSPNINSPMNEGHLYHLSRWTPIDFYFLHWSERIWKLRSF